MASATAFFDFEPVDKKGQPFPLSELKGKVVLVVNTASKCGFTPQFEGLEKLYKKLKAEYPDDFTILGFPCNQFGGQDPASNDEIQSFCQINYGVSFPVLGKLEVNGDNADPLFTWLKEKMPGALGLKRVKWNFEKFLVAADGTVVSRHSSLTKPESLEGAIVKEIQKAQKAGTAASTQKATETTGAEGTGPTEATETAKLS
ncbi:Glutathione peroxidase-like peroxiredoxin HYR1 [Penicillium macrosclerotiorum]|uniref:Glutathione peroxidase-like peroxiredoxin HYR1 n=1 Tax=Penicillium macrosclerotiorum TaxID=303699 RepID=UPI002548EB7A|nr:Glutathione peroxidase-like peroxiredoxin HYR1 [Penicillium macrosclerotiorum]KAJ5674054.1 Glutathione peroxidase-like peroxiredoxin HYR1 [Penicillium macrosclerotiorum]